MIVTEEEARTKWCPDARYRRAASNGDGATPVNRGGDRQLADNRCIGSACMAWRWRRGNLYNPVDERDKLPKDHANYADFHLIEGAGDYSATHGYCGKAGKP